MTESIELKPKGSVGRGTKLPCVCGCVPSHPRVKMVDQPNPRSLTSQSLTLVHPPFLFFSQSRGPYSPHPHRPLSPTPTSGRARCRVLPASTHCYIHIPCCGHAPSSFHLRPARLVFSLHHSPYNPVSAIPHTGGRTPVCYHLPVLVSHEDPTPPI